jgi:SAM-dependent methyltransferase
MASEAPFDPCESDEVAACVRDLAGPGPPLVTRIHPADEMYRFELEAPRRSPETAAVWYFAAARGIFRAASAVVAWRFGGWDRVSSFLDFASGYGRATRFFARSLPPSRITAAEIDPGAVRFQEEAFGVRGRVSAASPEALELPGRFDVVLAVSLFSHLPAGRFEAWLARLYGLVADGGVLVFSTHGPELLPEGETAPPSGIAFRSESETRRLDGSEYGTSWVTPDFVRAAAGRAGVSGERLRGFPCGLCGYQDLYVLPKPPDPSPVALHLPREPWGVLEWATVENGVVHARGWAAGDRHEAPPDVTLSFGATLRERSEGSGPAGVRREWDFTFPVSALPPDRIVRIEAVSAQGAPRLLVAETLRPYLSAP